MTRRQFILACFLGALALGVAATPARGEELKEYQIKAAFLYNFTQFVQWPDRAFTAKDEPFVIAVVGADPFAGELDAILQGKVVAGHPIAVRYFGSPEEIGKCHLLFIPKSEDGRLNAIFTKIGDNAVLTVGETDNFPWAGGTIRFFWEDNRIRFEVNLTSAEKAGLNISSRLLKLARIFKGK